MKAKKISQVELEDINEEQIEYEGGFDAENDHKEDISVVGEENVPLQTRRIRKSVSVDQADLHPQLKSAFSDQ